MAYGLEQEISCIKYLVVSDLYALCKRSGDPGFFSIAFKFWMFNTAIYGKIACVPLILLTSVVSTHFTNRFSIINMNAYLYMSNHVN